MKEACADVKSDAGFFASYRAQPDRVIFELLFNSPKTFIAMITLKNGNLLGFDEVVDTLDDALRVVEKIHGAASDGLGFSDIGTVIEVTPVMNEIRKDADTFVAQFEDLTPTESAQVAAELVARRGGDADTIVLKALGAVKLASRWHNTGAEVVVLVSDTIEYGKTLFHKAA